MDVSRPYSAVSPTLEGEVLVALSRTTHPLTGSEIAKLVRRGTRPGVQRALHRLVAHGVVNSQEAGRAILYVLNRDHLALPAVESLAGMRAEFLRRMREAIAGWAVQPVHVALFGSAARGDGDVEADIDVLIVRPEEIEEEDQMWRAQVGAFEDAVTRWTGNRVALSEISESEAERLRRDRSPIAKELERDAVVLAGAENDPLRCTR